MTFPLVTLRASGSACLIAAIGAGMMPACEPYRIERRTRPSFYEQASASPLPTEVELPDGTIMIYETETVSRDAFGGPPAADGEEVAPLLIREELEDGEIVLRSLLPEHVVSNTMTCLRYEEYDVLWDQLLSRSTRQAYESRGLGREHFAAFMDMHRREIMKCLNRMSFGFHGSDVILESDGWGGLRARLSPFIAVQFKFTKVDMAYEDGEMKLVMIR